MFREVQTEVAYKGICSSAPLGYAENNRRTLYFTLTHSKKYVYWYHDKQMTVFGGCYALDWFTNIQQHDLEVVEEAQEEVQEPESKEQEILPKNEWEQLSLF